MDSFRRHLLFLLGGVVAERMQSLRRRWDPVMATRTPPHVSLVYPEEAGDFLLVLERAARAAAESQPFVITLGDLESEDGGRRGVWFRVVDPSDTWNRLRSRILRPPFQPAPIEPHATVIHPRTSTLGPEALTEIAEVGIDGEARLGEFVFTETSEAGFRILERFPLSASAPRLMVAGLIREDRRVLLCHRRADRDYYPDVWDLPGGHVEMGESTMDALVRELSEELGVVPQPSEDLPWRTLEDDGVQLHVYLIDRWQGEAHNAAPDEHDRITVASVEELAQFDLAHPSYSEMLSRALAP